MNNYKRDNINNLISLWKLAGNSFQQYIQNEHFSYCIIPNSEWPNRIWFNKKMNNSILEKTVKIIKNSSAPLSLSNWSDFDNQYHHIFEKYGFIKKSEQIGMSLKLQSKFEEFHRLNFIRVTNPKQAKIWSDIFPQSFGYRISEEIINRTLNDTQYYLIYKEQQAIGTVIAHETDDLIGIHGMGIMPLFRKQGFAKEAMIHILNKALRENKKMATLQSSAMGNRIYKKLGFTEDFIINTFKLE
ncbi:GNAT family N-acetyltransferase [Ulvibacter litoralis]|nr:GNAT family N-acetyltransferase [Ulvibacter litoralis]